MTEFARRSAMATGPLFPERPGPVPIGRFNRSSFACALVGERGSADSKGYSHRRFGQGVVIPVGESTTVAFLDAERKKRGGGEAFKKYPTIVITEERKGLRRKKRHVIERTKDLIQKPGYVIIRGKNGKKPIAYQVTRTGTVIPF